MKKTTIIITAVFLLMILKTDANALSSQFPEYYCLKTRNAPVIDGELGDWDGAMVMTLNKSGQLIYGMVGSQPWAGPEDLEVFAYLMWDYDNLYLAIEVSDDIHSQDHNDGSIYAGDSVQLAFDSLNDGVQPGYDTNDNEYGLALSPDGTVVWCWVSATGKVGIDSRVKLGVKRRDDGNGTVYETAFPWEAIVPLNPDKRGDCGFSLLVNDNDGEGRAGWLEWTPGIGQGKDPAKFGNIIFVERLPEPVERKGVFQGCLYQDKEVYNIDERISLILSVNSKQEIECKLFLDVKTDGKSEKREESLLTVHKGLNYKRFYLNPGEMGEGVHDLGIRLLDSKGDVVFQSQIGFSILDSSRILKQFSEIEKSHRELLRLINDARKKRLDVAYPEISSNVIEYFLKWGKWDVQEREFKRAKHVAGYIDMLCKGTMREVKSIIDNPENVLSVPALPDLHNLKIHDGAIYAGDRPVFLFGAVGLNPDIENAHKYGFNLLYAENALWADYPTPEKCTGADTAGRLLGEYQRAEENNMAVSVQLASHYTPGWIYEKYPDTKLTGWSTFMGLSIDSQNTRKVLGEWYRTIIPMLSNKPALLSYEMENEINYMDRGKLSQAAFQQWLNKQYKGIEELNRVWGTGYGIFSEIVIPERNDNPASWYDWLTFNQYRLTEYFAWVRENIRKYDPVTPVQVKHIAEAVFEEGENVWGVDREGLSEICDISAYDMSNIGGLLQAMTLDYLKSLAPDKPLFNSECYYVRGPYTSGSKTRALIWQGALHGQCATAFWHWGHTAKDLDHVNLFCFQPWAMNSMGRTFLDINRLAEYVVEFPRKKTQVAMLFSTPSKFLSPKEHLTELEKVYEGLFSLGIKIDFITERQIHRHKASNYRLIIVPHAINVKEETCKRLNEYVRRGGVIFIVGNSFALDEHGRNRNPEGFLKVKSGIYEKGKVYQLLSSLEPQDYARRFNALLDEIMIKREPRVLDEKGGFCWEVETRTTEYRGRIIMYLINWGSETKYVQLKSEPRIKILKNLINGNELKEKFALRPLEVVLLSVDLKR